MGVLEEKLSGELELGTVEQSAIEYAVEKCKSAGYLQGIVDKEDFIRSYLDVWSYDNQLRKEGYREGYREGMLEFARKLLADGVEAEKIIKWTGLDTEALDELRKV